jgi:hypothetical protein
MGGRIPLIQLIIMPLIPVLTWNWISAFGTYLHAAEVLIRFDRLERLAVACGTRAAFIKNIADSTKLIIEKGNESEDDVLEAGSSVLTSLGLAEGWQLDVDGCSRPMPNQFQVSLEQQAGGSGVANWVYRIKFAEMESPW